MRFSFHALSASAVFLGAFLLFAIQPIEGKQLLPLFGGSSSVWATSLLFFTAALFVGYLYVYVLTKLPHARQVLVHFGILGVATLLLLLSFSIDIRDTFTALSANTPVLGVLFSLALSIGGPYVLLSTTGPLMQYWYAIESGKEPYALYSLSNIASLLALLSYPFLIEPVLSLALQKGLWSTLYLLYALLAASCAYVFLHRTHTHVLSHVDETPFLAKRSLEWLSLAALPAFALVSGTTHLTQVIAPVPLLWIVPLVLYLLSFILAFRGWGNSLFVPLFFLAAAVVAYLYTPLSYGELVPQALSYCSLIFFCALACHSLLYQKRPPGESSPRFYLLVSLGGVIGTLAGSIIAPLVFVDFWEFPLTIALSAALAGWILPIDFFPRILREEHVRIVKILFIVLSLFLFIKMIFPTPETPSVSTRNFYGNAEVRFGEDITSLQHGTTLHGTQYTAPENALIPTTYYTPGSGVGRAILFEQGLHEDGVRVAVVGLGTGTIAAYCRDKDTYVYYEIDERIETIARSYFSYLANCKGAKVRIGDGRLVLENELNMGTVGKYDVLAVDAFSDDTIPVHLLTKEAFATYIAHLRSPKSILAIHISNRYLDLSPIVSRLAAELGMNAILVQDSGDSPGGSSSSWVLLTKDVAVFQSVAFANVGEMMHPSDEVWTDDFSSLLPVLRIPLPWD